MPKKVAKKPSGSYSVRPGDVSIPPMCVQLYVLRAFTHKEYGHDGKCHDSTSLPDALVGSSKGSFSLNDGRLLLLEGKKAFKLHSAELVTAYFSRLAEYTAVFKATR
jgi:hypothetical protein